MMGRWFERVQIPWRETARQLARSWKLERLGVKGVFFMLEPVEKIYCFTKYASAEVMGIGKVEKEGGNLIVTDAFTIKQNAGLGHAHVDPLAFNEFCCDFIENGGDFDQLRLQWHSHGKIPALFSLEDRDNIEQCIGDSRVSLVVNKDGEYECRLDVFRPYRVAVPLPFLVLVPALPSIKIEANMIKECKMEMGRNVLTDALEEIGVAAGEAVLRTFNFLLPDVSERPAREKSISFHGKEWTPIAYEHLTLEE